jgi:hypothetical protein
MKRSIFILLIGALLGTGMPSHIVGDLLRRKSAGTEPNSILRIAYAHLKAYEARRAREAGAAADRSRS